MKDWSILRARGPVCAIVDSEKYRRVRDEAKSQDQSEREWAAGRVNTVSGKHQAHEQSERRDDIPSLRSHALRLTVADNEDVDALNSLFMAVAASEPVAKISKAVRAKPLVAMFAEAN